MRQRTLTILQRLILVSLFSSAVSNESFLFNDVDYETLLSDILTLKEKCALQPDQPPCQYLNSIQEESDKVQQKFQPNQDNGKPFNKDSSENEILIKYPFVSSLKSIGKRFTVFRRKNPNAQSYKRGPGFRSWGGKRDPFASEKRTKFTSWGGKREAEGFKTEEGENSDLSKSDLNDEVDLEKKSKFTSWGGKRDFNNDLEGEFADKRNKFASWGGKRTNLDEPDDFDKRSKFASWGGKRDAETPISYDQMEKRKSYWGYYVREPFKKHVPKRPQFQSWGGKRTSPIWSRPLGFYLMRAPSSRLQLTKFMSGGEKRKFSSWGGKRGNIDHILTSWGDKTLKDLKARQIFQNWGGKRPALEDDDDTLENIFNNMISPGDRDKRQEPSKTNSKNFPYESRSDFNSWGGKREEEKVER